MLPHCTTRLKMTECDEVESGVLLRLKSLSRQPLISSQAKAGLVRLHGWSVCLESGQIYTHCPEHERFVPLLEVPVIRGVCAEHSSFHAARARKTSRHGFHRNAGFLVASALSLVAIALLENWSVHAAPRIEGRPPSCACLTRDDGVMTQCSEDCFQTATEGAPAKRLNSIQRMVAWL